MRKYIDIIREFAETDPEDGGGENHKTYLVYNILWDVDDPEEEARLPKKLVVDTAEIEEHLDPYRDQREHDEKRDIGEYMQAAIDWRLSDFDYRPI